MKFMLLALSLCAFGSCSYTDSHSSQIKEDSDYSILRDGNFIIYKEKDNEHVVEVIDLELGWSRPYSAKIIDMNQGQIKELIEELNGMEDVIGEWAIDLCKRGMHCSKNGIQIAVPKGQIQKSWAYNNIRCHVINENKIEGVHYYEMECTVLGYSKNLRTKFSYSKKLGVTKYKIECEGCYRNEYELLSEKGLFADDCPPSAFDRQMLVM